MIRARALLLPLLLAVAGCATVPQPQAPLDQAAHLRHLQSLAGITRFSLSGRMGVQAEYKGFTGKLRWQHSEQGDQFSFYTPLGSQVAELVATPNGVTLTTSDQKTYTARDAQALLQQTMGWTLPLEGLTDWVLGRPAPTPYSEAAWDTEGRLTQLQQDGWNIEYDAYRTVAHADLPGKVVLKSRRLDLKLLVDQWNTAEADYR